MRFSPRPGSFSGVRADHAGDPLDGLVNLFDLALVLAVGFLLAALSSIGATELLTKEGLRQIAIDSQAKQLPGQPPDAGEQGSGEGTAVGTVYRLQDGRYLYQPLGGTGATGATTPPEPAPAPSPEPTQPPAEANPGAGATGAEGLRPDGGRLAKPPAATVTR